MHDIVLAVTNGLITTTSRQIAEHFRKQHGHVCRAISNLECSAEFRQSNFGSANYIDEQGKPRQEYTLTRDGFVFLCMGFTGKEAALWKERYIAAFNQMEEKLKRGTVVDGEEPIFHVTPSELDALVTQRMKDMSIGRNILAGLPRRRLDAEWQELGEIITETQKTEALMERAAQVTQALQELSRELVGNMLLAGDIVGNLRTLRERTRDRQKRVLAVL